MVAVRFFQLRFLHIFGTRLNHGTVFDQKDPLPYQMAMQALTLKAFLINQLDAAAELKIDCMAKNNGFMWNGSIAYKFVLLDTLSR